MSYTVRPAREVDQHLFAHLEVHKEEQMGLDALGKSTVEALLAGYRNSEQCYLGFDDADELCAAFGYVRHPALLVPWLLCADHIERPVEFLRIARRVLADWPNDLPMTNVVGAHNKRSIRWLKALGFTVGETPIRKLNGVSFLPFWKMPPIGEKPYV
jgi:hypothetical protein